MYRRIFNSISEAIMVCKIKNIEGKEKFICINVNEAFVDKFGLRKEDLLEQDIFDIFGFWDKDILRKYIFAVLNNKKFRKTKYIDSLRKYFDIELGLHEKDEFFIKFTDITDISEMKFMVGKYEFLFENARDVILFIDMDGNILKANNAAVDLYYYTKSELLEMKIFDLRFDLDSFVFNQMDMANENGIIFESEHKNKLGQKIPVEISSIGTDINGERVLLSIIRDITDRKKDREKIERLAYYDTLTRLPNRRFFIEELNNNIDYNGGIKTKVAIMFLDIDKFKFVNDNYGHNVGDILLCNIARRIENVIRNDDLVARLGGDEFVILNYNINNVNVLKNIASRINYVLKQEFMIENKKINVSASIGISIYPDDAINSEELMRKADITMYRVKESGGDCYLFYNKKVAIKI
ncbi:MAG: diguanylate cyclase [Peptostreptococcaceae bacterium]|jgi:diguanylate cyclase (GGDEF)-like protein/PAS domain S-box-containing protein|nr:diguanylate cyclase [Peptostreptococcaceae bacterium]